MIVTSEDSEGYDDFVDSSKDSRITYDYYAWNLTNPTGVLEGEKPVYQKVGPYSYKQTKHKFNITFSDDESEVSFRTWSEYEFIPEDSVAGADPIKDKFINLNIAYMSVIYQAGSEDNLATAASGSALEEIKQGLTGIEFQTTVFYSGEYVVASQVLGSIVAGVVAATGYPANVARSIVLNIWANDTSSAATVNGVPSAFRVSYGSPAASGISAAAADALFNPAYTGSLTNPDQTIWLAGLLDASTLISVLVAPPFSLTLVQAQMLFAWRALNFQPNMVEPLILANFAPYGVVTGEDLGYLQWATGAVTGGVSIQASAGLPGIPEIGLFTLLQGGSPSFDIDSAKVVLNQLNDSTVLAASLLAFRLTGQTPSGLTLTQTYELIDYLENDIKPNFIDATFEGGLFVETNAYENLFLRTDPFLAKVSPANAQIHGFLGDWDEKRRLNSDADTYLTGKDDASKYMTQVTFDGKTEIDIYNPARKVQGQSLAFIGPGTIKGENDPKTLLLFNDNTARDLRLKYNTTYTFKEIEVHRYKLDPTHETVLKSTAFNNPADYLFDMSRYYGAPIYLSQSDFLHCDPAVTIDKIEGVEQNETEDDLFFDIEPITGFTLSVSAGLQFSTYMPTSDTFNRYSKFVVNDTYFPLGILVRRLELTDEKADDFVNAVYGAVFAKNVLISVFCVIGGLIFIAGAVILFVTLNRYNKRELKTEIIELPEVDPKKAAAAASVAKKDDDTSESTSEDVPVNVAIDTKKDDKESSSEESSSEEESSTASTSSSDN